MFKEDFNNIIDDDYVIWIINFFVRKIQFFKSTDLIAFLHGKAINYGLEADSNLSNKLIRLYASLGIFGEFDRLPPLFDVTLSDTALYMQRLLNPLLLDIRVYTILNLVPPNLNSQDDMALPLKELRELSLFVFDVVRICEAHILIPLSFLAL